MKLGDLLPFAGLIAVPIGGYLGARLTARSQAPVVAAGVNKTRADTDNIIVTTAKEAAALSRSLLADAGLEYEALKKDVVELRVQHSEAVGRFNVRLAESEASHVGEINKVRQSLADTNTSHAVEMGRMHAELATARAHSDSCEAALYLTRREVTELREMVRQNTAETAANSASIATNAQNVATQAQLALAATTEQTINIRDITKEPPT